jgi:dTDP-4-dehydrorhamnose reductase
MDEGLVILGAKGMLGSDLAIECRNHSLNPLLLDLPEFDITNYSRIRYHQLFPAPGGPEGC